MRPFICQRSVYRYIHAYSGPKPGREPCAEHGEAGVAVEHTRGLESLSKGVFVFREAVVIQLRRFKDPRRRGGAVTEEK